jgi:hypothetical protein
MANFEKLSRKLSELATSANVSCKELTGVLEDLQFQIVDCGSAGHKIAKHPAVALIDYPNFNCGHNEGAKIHRQYIKKLYQFVNTYEEEIKEYLK